MKKWRIGPYANSMFLYGVRGKSRDSKPLRMSEGLGKPISREHWTRFQGIHDHLGNLDHAVWSAGDPL